jgi:hypothetical protein
MTLTIKYTADFTLILLSSMQITTIASSKAINYLVLFIDLNDPVDFRCQKVNFLGRSWSDACSQSGSQLQGTGVLLQKFIRKIQ